MRIYWRMTRKQYNKYLEVSTAMVEAAMDGNSHLQKQYEDQFRSLPGLPRGINMDLDLVVPLVTDEPTSITSYATTPTKETIQ